MGNQQPSDLEEKVHRLARNAVFGDGYLWKHPECANYKGIWTSTTPELLRVKQALAPSLFKTGVVSATVGKGAGRFKNAKPLFRLASVVHPVFTKYRGTPKEKLFSKLTLEDFGLWYLDDGCCVRRADMKSGHRITLSVGDCCDTPEKQSAFEHRLQRLFGTGYGRIYKNNSKATVRNKVWIMTKKSSAVVLDAARVFKVMPHKFPS